MNHHAGMNRVVVHQRDRMAGEVIEADDEQITVGRAADTEAVGPRFRAKFLLVTIDIQVAFALLDTHHSGLQVFLGLVNGFRDDLLA